MRSLHPLWVAAALGASGCGSTPCDDALDHVESCGIEGLNLTATGEDCGPFAECQAGCIQRASCNQLRGVLSGEDNPLSECLFECGE